MDKNRPNDRLANSNETITADVADDTIFVKNKS